MPFALVHEDGDLICVARDVAGFFVPRPSDTFWLLDCSARPARRLGNVELRVLDAAGDPIGAYFIGSATAERTRAPDRGLDRLDVEVRGMLGSRPHPLAGDVWNRWCKAKPAVINEWTTLPADAREAWLEVTRLHRRWVRRPDAPQGTVVALDATHVRTPVDFYCAMGEAVNGPGGYFGANLDGLRDCLRGGFGITAPFDLVWQPASDARFEPAVSLLRDSGVRVR